MQPGLISDFNIKIKHLPTSQMIAFKGWVTDFSDDFSSTWNPVEVYGRMDPLSTFQGTQRTITLGFSVVAGSRAEAIRNNQNVNKLVQFLYPVYDQGSSGKGVSCTNPKDQAIVAAAPLLRLQYANLVQNNTDQQGLVGYLQGINYAPNIDAGQFLPTDIVSKNAEGKEVRIRNTAGSPTAEMVYQELAINLSFTVLHTHLMGWVKGEENTFYFGGAPSESGETKYLSNFPHGGLMNPPGENLYRSTNHLNDMASESAGGYHYVQGQGGLDAAARNTPDYAPSLTEEDRTADGAGADVADANVGEMTGDC